MSSRPEHPYPELTPGQIERYMEAARRERALAARSLFLALGRAIRRGLTWARPRREGHAWPAKPAAALSPGRCR